MVVHRGGWQLEDSLRFFGILGDFLEILWGLVDVLVLQISRNVKESEKMMKNLQDSSDSSRFLEILGNWIGFFAIF